MWLVFMCRGQGLLLKHTSSPALSVTGHAIDGVCQKRSQSLHVSFICLSVCLPICLCAALSQDSLSDWAAALLLDKAAEAAKQAKQGKRGNKAASEEDMDWQSSEAAGTVAEDRSGDGSPAAAVYYELRPLLAAVASIGSAAGACLGKLCASMAAKKKLKAGAVARGLEALIAGGVKRQQRPVLDCTLLARADAAACLSAQQQKRAPLMATHRYALLFNLPTIQRPMHAALVALSPGFPAGSPAALGAWTVLREIAAQDPSAPSWAFLQERWTAVKQRAACGHTGTVGAAEEEAGVTDEAASLLLVISHTTAGCPKEQAEELAGELLQVRVDVHQSSRAAAVSQAVMMG